MFELTVEKGRRTSGHRSQAKRAAEENAFYIGWRCRTLKLHPKILPSFLTEWRRIKETPKIEIEKANSSSAELAENAQRVWLLKKRQQKKDGKLNIQRVEQIKNNDNYHNIMLRGVETAKTNARKNNKREGQKKYLQYINITSDNIFMSSSQTTHLDTKTKMQIEQFQLTNKMNMNEIGLTHHRQKTPTCWKKGVQIIPRHKGKEWLERISLYPSQTKLKNKYDQQYDTWLDDKYIQCLIWPEAYARSSLGSSQWRQILALMA